MVPGVRIFKIEGDLTPFSRMSFAGVLEDRGVFDGVRNVRMTFRMVPDIIWMGPGAGIIKFKGDLTQFSRLEFWRIGGSLKESGTINEVDMAKIGRPWRFRIN